MAAHYVIADRAEKQIKEVLRAADATCKRAVDSQSYAESHSQFSSTAAPTQEALETSEMHAPQPLPSSSKPDTGRYDRTHHHTTELGPLHGPSRLISAVAAVTAPAPAVLQPPPLQPAEATEAHQHVTVAGKLTRTAQLPIDVALITRKLLCVARMEGSLQLPHTAMIGTGTETGAQPPTAVLPQLLAALPPHIMAHVVMALAGIGMPPTLTGAASVSPPVRRSAPAAPAPSPPLPPPLPPPQPSQPVPRVPMPPSTERPATIATARRSTELLPASKSVPVAAAAAAPAALATTGSAGRRGGLRGSSTSNTTKRAHKQPAKLTPASVVETLFGDGTDSSDDEALPLQRADARGRPEPTARGSGPSGGGGGDITSHHSSSSDMEDVVAGWSGTKPQGKTYKRLSFSSNVVTAFTTRVSNPRWS